jgi:hypothetical protein
MSKKFLSDLNGNNKGLLKKFIDEFNGEPRIAWYPSAGKDFRALLYLHPDYSHINPASEQEPKPPDLFLFTDYFPLGSSTFLDSMLIHLDDRTSVSIEHIEELPRLNLPLHKELVTSEGSNATDKAVFMKIKITSNRLGTITYPVLYAFVENETFYCKKLVPNDAVISHIIHIRDGGALGGGQASGVWLLNVLKKLNCELFITDGSHNWQAGDKFALELCSSIPRENNSKLTPIRVLQGESWSDHGDITWNLIS